MLSVIADYAKDITCILALVAMFVKPVRETVFGLGIVREGQQCLLRAEIVRIYYRHLEERKMRQYEYENFLACYKAYKALGGNSFIDRICREVEGWEIVS